MNKIWTLMLISACVGAVITTPDIAIGAMLKGSNDAVKLSISLLAIYGFWLGFLKILDDLGATNFISKLLKPLIKLLFGKDVAPDTQKYISVNMSANMLGLGNASTPMGIKAINSMGNGHTATTNMIMLFVISATSLQLLPSTVIGMRTANGSANPTSFLFACTIATTVSTVLGIILVKILGRIFKNTKDEKLIEKKAK